jgi:heme-degrading monooxygenase HmoA
VHVIVWRFRPRAAREAAFERAYGAKGAWAQLFARAPGFLSTELLRAGQGHYLVIDRWESSAAFEGFKAQFGADYTALDRDCASLTDEETPLGSFVPVL